MNFRKQFELHFNFYSTSVYPTTCVKKQQAAERPQDVSSQTEVQNASNLAGEEGFEPSLTDPESAVLPLDDSPAHVDYSMGLGS